MFIYYSKIEPEYYFILSLLSYIRFNLLLINYNVNKYTYKLIYIDIDWHTWNNNHSNSILLNMFIYRIIILHRVISVSEVYFNSNNNRIESSSLLIFIIIIK